MICQHKFQVTSKSGYKNLVPCGKCYACQKNDQQSWIDRVEPEIKKSLTAGFITATYAPEHRPYAEYHDQYGEIHNIETLSKDHWKKFKHRVRDLDRKARTKRPIKDLRKMKSYSVGEYGTKNGMPHYHDLLIDYHPDIKETMLEAWTYGIIEIGDLKMNGAAYIMSDMIKQRGQTFHPSQQKPFRFISNGIGQEYIKNNKMMHINGNIEYLPKPNFIKGRMPRYIKNKIWPDKKTNQALAPIRERQAEIRNEERLEKIQKIGYESIEHEQIEAENRVIRKRKFFSNSGF